MNTPLLEYRPELEFLPPVAQRRGAAAGADRSLALAAELLEVAGEDELDAFLSGVIDQARAAGRAVLAAPQAQALKQALLPGLRQALRAGLPLGRAPLAGPVIDALGRQGASALKQHAARVFGLELEGLSPEDKEFELAQRVVRFADSAARSAAAQLAAAGPLPPRRGAQQAAQAAQAALTQAAQRYAPGLLAPQARNAGRWQRHGSRIVLFDC